MMPQTETAKAVAAEERTEETRSFVRRVRTAARRRYSPEEKFRIVVEDFRREVTVSDLYRRENVEMKPLVADLSLEGRRPRPMAIPMPLDAAYLETIEHLHSKVPSGRATSYTPVLDKDWQLWIDD